MTHNDRNKSPKLDSAAWPAVAGKGLGGNTLVAVGCRGCMSILRSDDPRT